MTWPRSAAAGCVLAHRFDAAAFAAGGKACRPRIAVPKTTNFNGLLTKRPRAGFFCLDAKFRAWQERRP
jgi:hypothetical protein